MSNKKIMKKVFDEHLNIDCMHNEIISKIEEKENRKQPMRKRILIPLTLVILTILLVPFGSFNNQNGKFQNTSESAKDILNINDIENENNKLLDVDGRSVDKSYEELSLEFTFIKRLEIPDDDKKNIRMIERYGSSNINSENYNTLIGYNLFYDNTDSTAYSEDFSYIDIFFSKTNKQKPRCYSMVEENLKESIINGTSVMISKYSNNYQILFQYEELYFDIETKNITESELITLLHSIVGGTQNE